MFRVFTLDFGAACLRRRLMGWGWKALPLWTSAGTCLWVCRGWIL